MGLELFAAAAKLAKSTKGAVRPSLYDNLALAKPVKSAAATAFADLKRLNFTSPKDANVAAEAGHKALVQVHDAYFFELDRAKVGLGGPTVVGPKAQGLVDGLKNASSVSEIRTAQLATFRHLSSPKGSKLSFQDLVAVAQEEKRAHTRAAQTLQSARQVGWAPGLGKPEEQIRLAVSTKASASGPAFFTDSKGKLLVQRPDGRVTEPFSYELKEYNKGLDKAAEYQRRLDNGTASRDPRAHDPLL